MTDIVESSVRSRMMAGIRGTDTCPEITVRKGLHRCGFRYSLHSTGLPGKPDFYFLQSGVVLFIDGCYWHGCAKCRHAQVTNRAYWSAKIQGNMQRDRSNNRRLRKAGLRVIRVWEHELRLGCKGPWIRKLNRLIADERASEILGRERRSASRVSIRKHS